MYRLSDCDRRLHSVMSNSSPGLDFRWLCSPSQSICVVPPTLRVSGMDNKASSPKKLQRHGTALSGDEPMNMKGSTKGQRKQQQTQIQMQQMVVRPRTTFITEIERSQHIKERTKDAYMRRFEGKLDANNRIIPTELPTNAYHGLRRNFSVNIEFSNSLGNMGRGQLTESDSYVPPANVREVAAFPVGDTKVFPPRRPKTGAWKLGLRQYDNHLRETAHGGHQHPQGQGQGQADEGGGKMVGVEAAESDNNSVRSFNSLSTASRSIKAVNKLKRQVSDLETNLRPTGSAAKLNSFLHTQYATRDLPELTKDQKQKYFGPEGTQNFFKTYRELKSRGEVLLDGYTDLERLVTRPADKNVFSGSLEELQTLGVLTPRKVVTGHEDLEWSDCSRSVSPLDRSLSTPINVAHERTMPRAAFGAHPSTLANPKVSGMVNEDGIHVSEDMISKVVNALNESAWQHGQGSTAAPPVLTAAEAAAEKERLERVARERHAEVTKHSSFVAIERKPGVKRSKTNPDMVALVKSSRLESLPVVKPLHKLLGSGAGPVGGHSLPSIKGAVRPASSGGAGAVGAAGKSGRLSGGAGAGGRGSNTASLKSAGPSRARSPIDSRRTDRSGATSPLSLPEMGEIVRTFSEDALATTPVKGTVPVLTIGGQGSGHHTATASTVSDFEGSDNEEEVYHSSKVYCAQPFSGVLHPAHVTGDVEGEQRARRQLSIDMDNVRSRLDEPFPEDPALECSYGPASPRAIFLAGCLNAGIPPITVALIRKKISATVNLAHMGLGTKVAKALAPCLSAVPYLQLLNLSDNNLEDEGLSALLRAIAKHKNIEILDISQNIIGSAAAEALADFLGHKDCRLQCLRMSNANIDDGECANFVDVLMSNHHLKELDMSNNLLGKDENLNAVQPNFVTGGESLSELLSNPKCPLRTLNLHWNMIRLEGAECLCNSLRTNRILTNLDLSYNALGSKAAGVLGAALMENNVLVELNVANNGIDEFGCFTLLAGMRENASLRSVILDGNPLGVQGGRILIKVATQLGHRLQMSAKNCDFSIHNSHFVFNINEPYGDFQLDMSVPFDRAVMFEILNICETDSTIEFNRLEYCESSHGSTFVPLKLVRFDTVVTEFTRHETRELRELRAFEALKDKSWDEIFHVAQRYCSLDPEVLVKADVEKLLKELRIMDVPTVTGEVFFTLDPMEFGWVDIHEVVAYLIKRAQVATTRIYDMSHVTRLALSTSPTTRYIPPKVGRIHIRTTEGFSCAEDTGLFKPISNSQCRQVLKSAEQSSNPLTLIIYAIEASRMRIEEAKLMYRQVLSKTDDAIMVIAVILQRMRSTEDAIRVLKHFIGTDVLRWRRLKQRLGTSLLPLIGIYSGYYHLDLSFATDRVCLKKLIERSVRNCDDRMRKKLGDTSQNGNWTCFRNEYHPDNPDARIIPKYFYPLPEKAKLEFDFINIARPDVSVNRAIGDDVIVDMCLMARLLDEDKVEWALARLNEHAAGLRKASLSNGRPMWKADIGRAMVVNDTVHGFYGALAARKKSLLKSQKREAATKTVLTREPSMKKPKSEGPKNLRNSMVERERERQREIVERQQRAAAQLKKSVNIEAFRSFNLKGKDHQMKQFWSKRLFEVMFESHGTDEMKSVAVLEFLEIMMSTWWLYCRHLALILEVFHIGCATKSSMGSYRVELVVMWFDRLLDVHNFEVILMVLNAEEQAAVYARIGILNIFNPCKPEGGHQLDLMRWEERQVAKMLIHLSVQEPGDNWYEPQFTFDHGFLPIPGWSLSVVWLTDAGLPNKGILSLEFFSGNGANMLNCLVDRRLRAMLCSLVLADQRDLHQEVRINTQQLFAMVNTEKVDGSVNVNFRSMLKRKQTKSHISLQVLNEMDAAAERTTTEGAGDSAASADGHGGRVSIVAPPTVKPVTFVRPHACANMLALGKQAPRLGMLYWDENAGKIMLPYSYKEANAHLKTVNIEWSYGDSEGKHQDSWHL